MKIISVRISLLLVLIVLTEPNIAGQHGWTVNPADFVYDGSVTAIIILDSEEVTEGTMGAFVDGECRGFIDASYYWLTGRTIFRITCYSNQSSGEILNFKYYDPGGEGTYYEINETIEFTAGMTEGSSWSPLEFHITGIISGAPIVGEISPPTCTVSTGSVVLSGLPSSGTWTLTRYPDEVSTSGTGTSTTISGIPSGTYNFTVTNEDGIVSDFSDDVVIPPQPPSPAAPSQTVDCTQGAGNAVVTVTSPIGSGLEYSLDGGTFQPETIFNSVDNGSHIITVRNSDGCTTTGSSFDISCACANPTTVTLSSTSGNTCGIESLTVGDNTFGGSATTVSITHNGAGSVSPASSSTSPFSFTYTPVVADIGNVIEIMVTTDNPLGSPCSAATATYALTVDTVPGSPVPGAITHPTCGLSTGSVVLEGLPSTGTWTIISSPGSQSITGTGTNTTFTSLLEGTYTFTVTNSYGCTSEQSEEVLINPQPETPSSPSVGTITPPTCSVTTGSVNLFGLPVTGTWTLTMYPGTIATTGTGSSTTISGLETGTYNFTVSNAAGCSSVPSANVVIPAQPPTPTVPVIGMIVQPTYEVPTGSLVLEGLPSSGSWTVTRTPGNIISTGTGTSTTITGLGPGVYNFTVTNSHGCTSISSDDVVISTPGTPDLIITNPDPVCYPETVDLTADEITDGSTPGLTYTYWLDSEATQEYATPAEATEGTYYIRGTTATGFFDIEPVVVTVDQPPIADAGPDQVLNFVFHTELNAAPVDLGHGTWTVVMGSGTINNDTLASTAVSNLSLNENVFLWTVTNGACPAATDFVSIIVNELVIPTLITPNNDSYNEYFILRGIEALGQTELIIFDRRGALVYKNDNYDNSWNGVDQNGNQLPADTYFYTIKSANGIPYSGYIVIKR
jgi:gliding motility-associated-like protein